MAPWAPVSVGPTPLYEGQGELATWLGRGEKKRKGWLHEGSCVLFLSEMIYYTCVFLVVLAHVFCGRSMGIVCVLASVYFFL